MYAFGRLISGNKAARSAIFFYALVLHAIIFLVLARRVVLGGFRVPWSPFLRPWSSLCPS